MDASLIIFYYYTTEVTNTDVYLGT